MSNQRVAVLSVHTSPMDQPGSGRFRWHERVHPRRGRAPGRTRRGGRPVHALSRRRRSGDPRDRPRRAAGDGQGRTVRAGAEDRPAAVPAGVPGWGPASREGGRARLRHPAQPLLALRVGRQLREGHPGHPARGVVPHAGQGQELLARPGRGARAAVAPRGRGAGDRRRRSDPGADARGGGPARRALPRRSRAHPDRAARRRPRDLLPARSRRGARPAAPVGPAARAVRREAPGAQGARRRGPHARGGRGARSRAHRRTWCWRSSAVRAGPARAPRWPG